jgi:GGDEF domain-containing protein
MLLSKDRLISSLFCETDRMQRMKSPLTVMFCGIREWSIKRTEFDEASLEKVKAEIARRLMRLLRCYDSAGRWDDGRYAVVLPGCSSFNAASMAERVGVEVFGEPLQVADNQVRLSGCFGVAGSGGRNPLVVLREAERALEVAEARGAGSIERCRNEAEPDPAMFLIPVIEDEALHW